MATLNRLREYSRRVGPTWLAGAIAAGPATMASLITGGASFGYALLWIALLSALLGALSQYLAMRLGLLTEAGIVSVVEEHLGNRWAWLLVVDAVLAAGLAQLTIMKTVASVSATITGLDATVWAIVWGLVLAIGLAGGGYRLAEFGAKILVSLVVLAFLTSLVIVPIDISAAAEGLIPRIPAGVNGALVAAGILGGAVHITLVTMQSYTMNARNWTRENYGLARFDVGVSMIGAFGIYSLAIFLVTASVLYRPGISAEELTATAAAQALGPLVGSSAGWLFLLGLWGAAVSTLGANTVVPPYLLADKLNWKSDVSDWRYRVAIVTIALAGIAGVFIGGDVFPLLVLTLAFGLVGTPFALALVLYLLNNREVVPTTNSLATNIGGIILIAITTVTAGSFLEEQIASGLTVVTLFVLVFAAVLGIATLWLFVLFVRERFASLSTTTESID